VLSKVAQFQYTVHSAWTILMVGDVSTGDGFGHCWDRSDKSCLLYQCPSYWDCWCAGL